MGLVAVNIQFHSPSQESNKRVNRQIVWDCTSSLDPAHVLCVDTGRSSETAKAHRG
eukprot:TRINITY_DN10013_c0_g1_i1.p1 TRINITY_DN10013_c0_g1~~TRINITY_DN10013_c0_g1_i1.p1  ORF type:complete len:56 (+),score=7.18 TRINITY_DN10013_c0_g1_i1:135-302(+)